MIEVREELVMEVLAFSSHSFEKISLGSEA